MAKDSNDVSPDQVRLTVDGQVFDLAYGPSQPGAYGYSWVNGPNEATGLAPGVRTTSAAP
ncbi:hypothetical protein [Nocardioides sp. REDSEA-S30_B4]|uniref:hypothetical protein n=1 Tax=Nocardioides sp. REDSEA-S30_B4 TaxID=1811552 RepID=UPI000A9988EA|nr:hypothetical protein [Nocardioides sp. REDSEA-S30_B4]